MLLSKVTIALLALGGTGIQMYQGTKQLRHLGSIVRDVVAVEDLRTEFTPIRHPFRWFSRQREIWRLLNAHEAGDAHIAELRTAYVDVSLHIVGWALLMGAAAGGFCLVLMGG